MNFLTFLEKNIMIKINDTNIIEQALTHPSYANEISEIEDHYERLEFIGDAILQFLVSDYIFKSFPDINEGEMTVLRAKAVREDSLARYALEYHLPKYIKVGKGEKKSGGTEKKSVLANAFEALVGAIYLSNGIEDASKFISVLYKSIEEDSFDEMEDYKTKLQEYIQSDSKRIVKYELVETSGSANNPTFHFRVLLDDIILGHGVGSSKKRAQQNAAQDALKKMVINV